ncbi:DNA-binding protein, partial [Candidatus Competibacter denitrificans]|uniref:DNA-binding protein n=1 Tax=Candidatus Competibacter denitrificans TaxID=1400862 RepID=UPI0006601C64
MKAWYTAQELASSNLPGIPKTVSAIIRQAKKAGWNFRKRAFGKGLEYAFDSLPEATRLVLLKDSARTLLTQTPLPVHQKNPLATLNADQLARTRAEGDAKAAALDGKARLRMDTRLEVLRQFERYCAQENASHCKFGGKYHKAAFAIAWNKGEIASSARDLIPILSSDKLTRWRKQCQREGLARL